MRAACRRWGHLLVLMLVLPLALSSALPFFARIAGGPAPHVCHCALSGGHSTCACPICNPDRDDLKLNEVSLRGKCGDDDVAFGGALGRCVSQPAGFAVIPPDLTGEIAPSRLPSLHSVFLTPPTPPPRALRS